MGPQSTKPNGAPCTIHVEGEHRSVRARTGETLLLALARNGIFLRSDCGGKGVCRQCTVQDTDTGERMPACQVTVTEDLSVRIPSAARRALEVIRKPDLERAAKQLLRSRAGRVSPRERWGAAVDVGTTTLAVYLSDRVEGRVLASTSLRNPQFLFGDDVMARISAVDQNPAVLGEMQAMVLDAVAMALTSLAASVQLDPSNLCQITVVGNPTMIHIFWGVDPTPLGRHPYEPAFRDLRTDRASLLGWDSFAKTRVTTLPLLSGFLGADTVACALALDLLHSAEGTLLVDVGTNGELLLKAGTQLLGTSCATGPALEGAAIGHGMPAVSGAVRHVEMNPDATLRWEVIRRDDGPDPKPLGICGSGVLSAVAALYSSGIVQKDGRIDISKAPHRILLDHKGIPSVILVDGSHTALGTPILFTQKDVRAVQLAKAALRTGIDLLCRKAGIHAPSLIHLAGTFGSHLGPKDAITIGMLPPVGTEKVRAAGNAAGLGALLALVDPDSVEELDRLAASTRVVELASHPDFQETFVSSLAFP
ncbi:Uncharacterized 2Fe-2 and 4Fe-4S clusters-containing protein, contains DUF4445 domain [Desulfacinum hydrothermale DSM 13146]|uniref:Uncharacterized 2Fe-2 and 4Fe-4S clusters-containing protein, contains DUF4445 domain n=1 Tax=Desulfacinum hydrothermale DSM 13146 TaxID=1121390 RepID=A0A1W1X894_9BACT|nr:ASKHA domain-containing protein [Desulfacinum hydrothermale]SMC20047.1 Uncharacterized 2Fe-2 and 4Fe-4S clusters-containing protein, contains DUF4445 domain [Desulfacinum hydrothermale DSM 13146]